MKYLINYADGGFYESRAFNSISGIKLDLMQLFNIGERT